jgi:dephospho-CoA kinase
MRVIALTGGIGCGKSLAAQFFAELGALVIDADQLARAAIERGSKGFDEVITVFGDGILKDGDINRRALGELVFKDPTAKQKLESIVHPFVRHELVETGAHERFDLVITVESEMENRIARLRSRGMHISEIEGRIAAQATREQRVEVADFLIENDGSEDELLRQVENIWDSLHDN